MTETKITYDKAIAWAKKTREFNKTFNGTDFKGSPEETCEIFEAAGIVDKESYLAWRETYRDLINYGARVRKFGGPGREAITRMIEIRRASKVAAAAQYSKIVDKAA
jgi:hypothetical protein